MRNLFCRWGAIWIRRDFWERRETLLWSSLRRSWRCWGVPMVAIPITNDQPGVAARIAWCGVGEFVTPRRLTVPRLRTAIQKVWSTPAYRENAQRLQREIAGLQSLGSSR